MRTCAGEDSKMSDSTPVAGADQEVLITRIFDAPRELVFKAWTDPEDLAAWYGPEHMDTPRERISIDLRVGGRSRSYRVVDSVPRRARTNAVPIMSPPKVARAAAGPQPQAGPA